MASIVNSEIVIGEPGNRLLFITANTGSLFEETSPLEAGWIREIANEVNRWKPVFFALHMQEIGGKHYHKHMRFVKKFIDDLRETFAALGYPEGRVYLDEEKDAEDRFTALGSAYFFNRNYVQRVSLFDFRRNVFHAISGFEVHSLNENNEATVERTRFPKSLFSEVKWSRKGFMRTRWRLNDATMDLVNIHLFHDACNLLAVEQSPSVYSNHRKAALVFALNELTRETIDQSPMFIFGDFNFRLDSRGLVENLTPMSEQLRINDGNGMVKVEYRRHESTETILRIGTKLFDHMNHDTLQFTELLPFDKELTMCPELKECPIAFPPSYPYSESAESPTIYMRTRAPAWCDRVLMNDAAWKLVKSNPSASVVYDSIGQNVCMGDHKPVYLTFSLPLLQSSPVNGDSAGSHE